jgi:fucose permease
MKNKQLPLALMILAIVGASAITYLFLWVPSFYGIGVLGLYIFIIHILIVVVLFIASIVLKTKQ